MNEKAAEPLTLHFNPEAETLPAGVTRTLSQWANHVPKTGSTVYSFHGIEGEPAPDAPAEILVENHRDVTLKGLSANTLAIRIHHTDSSSQVFLRMDACRVEHLRLDCGRVRVSFDAVDAYVGVAVEGRRLVEVRGEDSRLTLLGRLRCKRLELQSDPHNGATLALRHPLVVNGVKLRPISPDANVSTEQRFAIGRGTSTHEDHIRGEGCSATHIAFEGSADVFEFKASYFWESKVHIRAGRWKQVQCKHSVHPKRKRGFWVRQNSWPSEWTPGVLGECELDYVDFEDCLVDTRLLSDRCQNLDRVRLLRCTSTDRWEELRDSYSGAMMALHLGLVGAYLVTLLVRIGAYSSFSAAFALREFDLQGWREVPVLQLVAFGFNEPWSPLANINLVTLVLVLLYQLLRAFITVRVVKLRAREDHLQVQGFKSCRPAHEQFAWLLRLHFLNWWLMTVALLSLLFKLVDILLTHAWVPIR